MDAQESASHPAARWPRLVVVLGLILFAVGAIVLVGFLRAGDQTAASPEEVIGAQRNSPEPEETVWDSEQEFLPSEPSDPGPLPAQPASPDSYIQGARDKVDAALEAIQSTPIPQEADPEDDLEDAQQYLDIAADMVNNTDSAENKIPAPSEDPTAPTTGLMSLAAAGLGLITAAFGLGNIFAARHKSKR